jgi:hypothetical protein
MANPFSGRAVSIGGPATDILPITPNDSTDLPDVAIALYVESGGVVVFDSVANSATRTVTVGDGAILPVGARRVRATGTTANGIHALVIS